MATTSDRVMNLVRAELDANPEVKTGELFEKAKRMEPSLGMLTIRQFHARYPLQIKRKLAQGRPRKKAKDKAASGSGRVRGRRGRRARAELAGRDDVRSILLQFAGEIAAAEGKVDVVKVIGGIDGYVDRVIEATVG